MILGYHPGIRVLTQNQVRRGCGDWMMWIWGSNFEKVIELAGLIPVIWIHLEVSQVIRTAKWSRLFSWAVLGPLGLVTRGSHEILAAYNFFFEHIGIRKGGGAQPNWYRSQQTVAGGSWTDRLIMSHPNCHLYWNWSAQIESLGTLLEFQTFPFAHLHAASHGGWRTPPFKREDVQVQRKGNPLHLMLPEALGSYWILLDLNFRVPDQKKIFRGAWDHRTAHCFFKDQLYAW